MSASGLARHAWWSLRRRFGIVLAIVAGHAVGIVLVFALLGGTAPADWEMTSGERESVTRVVSSYEAYVGETWSGTLVGLLAVAGVVLGAGGVPSERRQGTLDLTLSLPVRRSHWLLGRWVLVLALLPCLAAVSAVLVGAGGGLLGVEVPGRLLAANVLISGLAPAYAVAAAILATTWTRDVVVASLAALVLLYLTAGAGAGPPGGWAPGILFSPEGWGDGAPWRPLLSTAALTAGFLVMAIRHFERDDA